MHQRVIYDLGQLPRVADGWTFLYTEKVRIERVAYAIELRDKHARTPVPCAALSALLLGPGSTITHAAVLALAESGCSIVWGGEGLARFYAAGLGETRRAHHLEAQAKAWALPDLHLDVVRRMYTMRFPETLPDSLTIEQIRGREGVRVRQAYAEIARETGVTWNGRDYNRGDWSAADPVNRALSASNACLYGVCHAAIAATGFSPGLGFVHAGKMLSFVYDIADLYKVDVSVPAAFRAVQQGGSNLESRVRRACRELFLSTRLIERIVPDMQSVLGLVPERAKLIVHRGTEEDSASEAGMGDDPGSLWNPDGSRTIGGKNFSTEPERSPRPPLAKTTAPERGDAYEDDIKFAIAAGDDDDGAPF